MTTPILDDAALVRAVAALAAAAEIVGKAYNPDQPRAANGEWGSGGGSSDGHDDREPGEGYEPDDQARHDAALAALGTHAARLQATLNRASAVFNDDAATAAQVVEAARAVATQYDATADALQAVNAVRDLYDDVPEEAPVLDDTAELRQAVGALQDAFGTVRAEPRGRARLVARPQS